MFKAVEVERKIRINLLTDMQINLSLYKTSDHYLWDSIGTKNLSSTNVQNF